MKNDIEWLKEKIKEEHEYNRAKHNKEGFEGYAHREFVFKYVLNLINQLDEPEVLSQEWIVEHEMPIYWMAKEQKVVRVEHLQNLLVPKQEEPTQEQVQKYLSEHGVEVVEKEPETVADVISDFWKSYERLKEAMSMEVEELEE